MAVLLCALAFAVAADPVTHTYDAQNRLIRSEYDDGSGIEYTYDAAGNRIGQKAFQVAVGKPDLVVTAMTSTGSGVVGGKIKTYATVKNQGNKDAGEFWVVFYLSKTSTFNPAEATYLKWGCKIPSLAVGESFQCNSDNTPIPDTLEPGTYYAVAHADSGQVIDESNETNNTLVASTATVITKTIPNLPDLIVTALTSSATGELGWKLDMTMGLKNQGQQDAGAFWVNFYLSTDSSITRDDAFTGSGCEFKEGLKAGMQSTCERWVRIPARLAPGTYYLGAYIDDYGTVEESDEANNTLAASTATVITEAVFHGPTYPLTVNKSPNGVIRSLPEGIYCGIFHKTCKGDFSSVTLTATEAVGYYLKKWVGCPAPEDNTCSLTLTNKTLVNAVFAKLPKYALKIVKTQNGEITSDPAGLKCKATAKTCSAKFVSGTRVSLNPIPQAGYSFGGWDGACSGTGACEVIMDGKKVVGARFE